MTRVVEPKVPTPVLASYVAPALVIALPTIPVYIHLPSLYGVELGLGLAATGVILLIARLFDAVTDPLIGELSDRFSFSGAHRKPWIAVGAGIAGIGLYKVLTPPEIVNSGYLLTWLVILYTGWTMVSVPYLAWGAELSGDYYQRARITAWREGIALFGIIGAGVLTAVTAQMGWSEARSVSAIAWVAILLGVAVLPFLFCVVPDGSIRRTRPAAEVTEKVGFSLRALSQNRPFLRLLSGWFINGLANGIPAALFFIYLEYGLGAGPEERPLFILTYFAAGVAAIPIWLRLSRHFGKHRVWCWAMAAACLAFLIVPFLSEGSFFFFACICVVTGMALGADLALPPAIQADVIDFHRLKFGSDHAGLQFALWGMSTKLSLALAVGLALPALEGVGFRPDNPSENAIMALVMIYSLVPVVLKAIAIFVVYDFPLTRVKHAVIRRRLGKLEGRK
ncbi:MAG: MFS transporter [Rhodospirillales bacterium]|nr:MFS transporter [Rhodospirillales bacterium]